MKVMKAVIENFRHIEKLELSFTDSVGRARDLSVIIGPNTSGKTTILDALAVALGLPTELPYARPDFVVSPRTIVRRGALTARVTCEVSFSPEEVDATHDLFHQSDENGQIPDVDRVQVTWEYPWRDRARYPNGHTACDPPGAWRLFKGRVKVARLLPTGRVDWQWFERVGGVFTFDQQRTGMGKVIPRDTWNIIHGNEGATHVEDRERRTTDPRTILLALAVQSGIPAQAPSLGKGPVENFRVIQERYAEVCAPRSIKGVVRDELGELDLLFSDGRNEYSYDGLSSGEQMLLLFMIRMVTEHIHHSIVLVDEIELHQHPLWQRKLLYLLPRIGIANQIIATSHSNYIRDVVPPGSVIALGELGDQPRVEESCG